MEINVSGDLSDALYYMCNMHELEYFIKKTSFEEHRVDLTV